MLYGGVVSDRVPRRKVLMVTQAAMMILAVVLAALTFTGAVEPWHIIVLAGLLGLANAFDAPARQAFVSELVDREDLSNAIALNATMFNTATATGPALAGLAYDLLGPGWCFALNAASFLAVIAALGAMRLPAPALARASTSLRGQLTEGLSYVARDKLVRTLIAIVGVSSGLGFAVNTVLPAWAVTVLGGDARTNGLLFSARGLGAMMAALAIASFGRARVRGRILTMGTIALPLFLLLFSFVRDVPGSLLTMALVGASFIMVNNNTNALVQTTVPDALRGRVMGVYTLTFFGMMPIGSLVIGGLAERAGEPAAVAFAAFILGVSALLALIYAPRLRHLG
jgi:MFS family permease